MISIIIPAYNEGKRLGISLEKLAAFLKNRKEDFETIVVDDASSDNTRQVAESFKEKISNLKVMELEKSPFAGKGFAVNKGVLAANGYVVLFTDADFSTPIEEIDKLLEKLNNGFDIAVGSRALDRSTVKKHQNPIRQIMARTFNILVQILAVRGIKDTQCGFKAFKMPACRSLFEEEKIFDFGFDVELLFLARRKNLKIAEVPVHWYNDEATTVHPIKDSYKMFIDLFKIRLLHSDPNKGLVDKLFYLIGNNRTMVRFAVVGVTNTLVDYSLFYLLTRFLGFHALLANPISVETAIMWSFTWNSLWTFSERKLDQNIFSRFVVFQIVSLGGLLLSQISLLVFTHYLGIFDLFSKALSIPIVLVFNYLLNSRWTFRDTSLGKTPWKISLGIIFGFLILYIILINLPFL